MDYDLLLAMLGFVGIAAALVPRLLHRHPMSYPIVYVAAGLALAWLPLGVSFRPFDHPELTQRLTELGVILALMGSGLKMDRAVGWRRWGTTWRLLGVTMPLTIAATLLLGWWAGLPLAAALLAAAVLAPTDPVLASDVQVPRPDFRGPPEELETRFALTSEAGLNDGLAFPFTMLAIAFLAARDEPGVWLTEWVLRDVAYKIGVGVGAGIVLGRLSAYALFRVPSGISKSSHGFVVVPLTLVIYAITQLLGAYGFVAVFVAAVALRGWERRHEYHRVLHDASQQAERSVLAVLLVLFGASLASGLLQGLTIPLASASVAVIAIVRPLSGWVGMWASPLGRKERAAVSFFGIRGIGSFYYLSFALNRSAFPAAEQLWAFVAFTVLISIIIHGSTARSAMDRIRDPGVPGDGHRAHHTGHDIHK